MSAMVAQVLPTSVFSSSGPSCSALIVPLVIALPVPFAAALGGQGRDMRDVSLHVGSAYDEREGRTDGGHFGAPK